MLLNPKPVVPVSSCLYPQGGYSGWSRGTQNKVWCSSMKGLWINCLEACWNGKKCRLVTGVFTGQWTLRWHLHIMSLSENAMCRKREKEVESPYHVLCPCLALATHRVEIFDSAWIQLTDIWWASIRMVLAVALRSAVHNEHSSVLNACGNWQQSLLSQHKYQMT
jgi:hypothetical protein